MKKVRLSITLRPEVKAYIAKQAKKRQMSFSRYIESMLYKEDDEDYTYTMEELYRDSKEAKKLSDEARLPSFENIEEAFEYLGI
ncbi:MAG: hypothetical protein ACSW8C_01375 [bacterium]